MSETITSPREADAAASPPAGKDQSAKAGQPDVAAADSDTRRWSQPEWLKQPLVRQLGSWMLSMIIHMVMFMLVATFLITDPTKRAVLIPETFDVVDHDPDDYTVVLDKQTTPS